MVISEGRATINYVKDQLKARRFRKAVDKIGNLRNRAAKLKAEGKDLEKVLYQHGENIIEGRTFTATIVPSERNITEWKKIAIDLGASNHRIAANTRTFEVVAIRIASRNGKRVQR